MPVSLKTMQLLQRAGVTGDLLREIVASIFVDNEEVPHVSLTEGNQAHPLLSPRKRRVRGVSRSKREEVFLRDGFICQYCRDPDARPLSVDHIHPMSKGGSNDMGNLRTACEPCNFDKGDLTIEEWETKRGVRLSHLPTRPPLLPRKQISAHDAATVKEGERILKQMRSAKVTAHSQFRSPTPQQIAEADRIAREALSYEKTILSKARKADRSIVEGAQRALAAAPRIA